MSESERAYAVNKPVVAIVLALVAGVFSFIEGFVRFVYVFLGFSMTSLFGSFGDLLRESTSFSQLMGSQWTPVFVVVDLLVGLLTLSAAIMLDSHPRQARKWGTLIMVSSLFVALGGSFTGLHIATVSGFIGGLIAILWKPELI